ncbi:glycosyl hydrolase 115 family protein [Labilibaculum manganireducens]|uniref:glycosyl hydrolase 115 family protein n=1 Tax=Labilibaculum manganireducens TaxID=1940525 RepID=UPI0029F50DCD|nr:glycosyl hydrolase 115 family protein [Labilibaculum manganireducens]
MFRNRFRSVLIIITAMLCVSIVEAQNKNDFTIVVNNEVTGISIDKRDAKVVEIAAKILADDIFKVTGKPIQVTSDVKSTCIIAGTIGNSRLIDQLIAAKKLDVSKIKGQWETYSIQILENPVKGVEKALVIVGSDRRATAYGLLEISRMIGVSPWEWWADVTPDKKENAVVSVDDKVYGSPSVKYRGIFLNDEDWGLQRWAALNFEPETGDIGSKTYAKVFELLLRLRANTVWPAMHSCTKPFYYYPKNKQIADDYAIVVGTSHCEPMLCNINAEWNSETMGEWRYDNNSETIKKLFQTRTKESADFEGIYTMGMRGKHDSPMIVGQDDTDSQVKLLENVITDQRRILEQQTGKKASELPQIFIPYKEVLTCYQNGMQVPEDISLVWTDDNYGYIRQLSNGEEQKRSGGAGIYYHTSYWGRPHDYLWLNSTNPVLMWEEMSKAYEFQSRNLWILNCGDIKPHEYNIQLFLDMAWDMSSFDKSKGVKNHMQNWAAREFGSKQASAVTNLMYEYYRLAFQRRPEFMAWSQVEPVTKQGQTELTQINYGDEVSTRINEYQKLLTTADKINDNIAENRKDAFYELVYYPVMGAANLNFKWLYSYKNQFTAQQGRISAEYFGQKSLEAFQRIQKETNYFNKQLQNGKWNHIMSMAPRQLPVFSKPTVTSSIGGQKAELGLALESCQMEVNNKIINSYADVLPVFNAYTHNSYFVDVFLKGEGEISWKAEPKAGWIHVSQLEGEVSTKSGKPEQRLWVSIDWDKVPAGENKKEAPLGHDYQLIPPGYKVNSAINFISADTTFSIGISVFNPKFAELEHFKGFVEDKGFVSMHAKNFNRKVSGTQAQWQVLEGLGYTGSVVSALPNRSESIEDLQAIVKNSPSLEYDFYTFNFGEAEVLVQAVPTHAVYEGKGVRCAVSIDDAEPVIVDFQTLGRSNQWKENVLKNATIQSVQQIINKAGKHTLKVWMVDAGVMIDQILIDLGGWKKSYAFPQESKL